MTIVASNSITVSNINDGTITHYAYAYSADGTDRFTTVYPNLNLLNFKSGLKIGQNLSWTDGLTLLPNPARAIFDYISVIPGTTYTINSNWDKTERIAIFAYDSNDTKNATFIYEGISSKWFPPSTIGRAITQKTTLSIPDGVNFIRVVIFNKDISATLTLKDILDAKPKVEPGSTATPWMPSSSEVTTADWPSYIGQYSDFTVTASTDPAKYAPWTVFKGNDGKDGATGPQGPQGNIGPQGPTGPAGVDGSPGKIVSDTEPTTRFKGLTWKYSGTSDLTASDGTVILSGTEYYWSGTNWILSEINAHNINGNNLTITDGEFSSTIIDGPVQIQTEIKDDHLLIYKMDTSHNEIHTIALKSDSGLAMTYQNSDTGEYTSAGVNFQGLFMQNNITNEFARLTPRGTDLSTDVPWTNLTLASGFSIGSGGKARYRVKNGVLYIHFRKIVCPALSGNQPNTLCYVPANGRASDGYDSFGVTSATNSTRIQYNDSGDGKVAIVPASNTTAGQGFNGFLICPID